MACPGVHYIDTLSENTHKAKGRKATLKVAIVVIKQTADR